MIKVKKHYSGREAEKLVRECENRFETGFRDVALKMLKTGDAFGNPVRVIALCGPSCAGKTTAADRLDKIIEEEGYTSYTVSFDDFYYEREVLLERSKGGEIDFDSPDTIDLTSMRHCLKQLFEGELEEIEFPVYDFVTGKRSESKMIPSARGNENVYIFEGIQAFYPEVKKILDSYGAVSLFINVATDVKCGDYIFDSDDIRLLRRIVRDYRKRAASADYSLLLWNNVRKNEEENILPLSSSADYFFDTSMGYDIQMLKPYLVRYLKEIPADSQYRQAADDILLKITDCGTLSAGLIGKNSLFREFL